MHDYVTNYEEAVEFIYRIPRFNSNHSLENIKQFLAIMGQPDSRMKIIHVAGTNGKGSTSNYLAGLLTAAGLKTGLFTSPHLVDMRERFRINGEMIAKALFVEAVQHVQKHLKPSDTFCFFDVLFFCGMYAFSKEQVDILILETGLGGRLDATNGVQDKVMTLITHIGLDHTEQLGNTLKAIAFEKAGIMKAGVPCVVGAHNEQTAEIFLRRAAELGSTCRILDSEAYGCQRVSEKSVAFSYFSSYYGTIQIDLNTKALYQTDNAALALAGLETLFSMGIASAEDLSADRLCDTLKQTVWAGRMEEIRPGVYLDGAHNVDGIEAFLNSIRHAACKGKRSLIFSAVSDKDYEKMLELILQSGLFDEVYVTQIFGERGAAAQELYDTMCRLKEGYGQKMISKTRMVRMTCIPDLATVLLSVLTKKQHLDDIYIIGSLYLVGQTRKLLSDHEAFSEEEKGELV